MPGFTSACQSGLAAPVSFWIYQQHFSWLWKGIKNYWTLLCAMLLSHCHNYGQTLYNLRSTYENAGDQSSSVACLSWQRYNAIHDGWELFCVLMNDCSVTLASWFCHQVSQQYYKLEFWLIDWLIDWFDLLANWELSKDNAYKKARVVR